jgi:hypothetical protein
VVAGAAQAAKKIAATAMIAKYFVRIRRAPLSVDE